MAQPKKPGTESHRVAVVRGGPLSLIRWCRRGPVLPTIPCVVAHRYFVVEDLTLKERGHMSQCWGANATIATTTNTTT